MQEHCYERGPVNQKGIQLKARDIDQRGTIALHHHTSGQSVNL